MKEVNSDHRLLKQIAELHQLLQKKEQVEKAIDLKRQEIGTTPRVATPIRQYKDQQKSLSPRLVELMRLLAADKKPFDKRLRDRLSRAMHLNGTTVAQYLWLLRSRFQARDFKSLVDVAKSGAFAPTTGEKLTRATRSKPHWMQRPENKERVKKIMQRMSNVRDGKAPVAETAEAAPAVETQNVVQAATEEREAPPADNASSMQG